MIISMIAAMGNSREIGLDNKMLWHIPADFAHFKNLTMGKTLLMGRKTYDSIGRPLPGRKTIVVTSNRELKIENVSIVHSLEEGVELARSWGETELFVSGGANIYKQMLEKSDRLHLSYIDFDGQADTFFPEFDEKLYETTQVLEHPAQGKSPFWCYKCLNRIN